MDIQELYTELQLMRRDVDDIKNVVPDIKAALQQLAVTNERLSQNMEEHKYIWENINGMRRGHDSFSAQLVKWGNHDDEHTDLDSRLKKIELEHAVCVAKQQPQPETTWDKAIKPTLIGLGILALAVLILIHASDLLKVLSK